MGFLFSVFIYALLVMYLNAILSRYIIAFQSPV
jgi:hypothetical protein